MRGIGRYENIISVGKKKGEWDFSVRATIAELSFEEMNQLRAMIIVSIGTMEGMWRRNSEQTEQMANE